MTRVFRLLLSDCFPARCTVSSSRPWTLHVHRGGGQSWLQPCGAGGRRWVCAGRAAVPAPNAADGGHSREVCLYPGDEGDHLLMAVVLRPGPVGRQTGPVTGVTWRCTLCAVGTCGRPRAGSRNSCIQEKEDAPPHSDCSCGGAHLDQYLFLRSVCLGSLNTCALRQRATGVCWNPIKHIVCFVRL